MGCAISLLRNMFKRYSIRRKNDQVNGNQHQKSQNIFTPKSNLFDDTTTHQGSNTSITDFSHNKDGDGSLTHLVRDTSGRLISLKIWEPSCYSNDLHNNEKVNKNFIKHPPYEGEREFNSSLYSSEPDYSSDSSSSSQSSQPLNKGEDSGDDDPLDSSMDD